MKKIELVFGALRIPADLLAVGGALLLSYWLRINSIDLVVGIQLLDPPMTLPPLREFFLQFALPALLLYFIVALMQRLYAFKVTQSFWSEAERAAVTCLLWLTLVMAWYFFVRKELFSSRILLLHATVFMMLFTVFVRAVLTAIERWLLQKGYGVRRVMTIGSLLPPFDVEQTLRRDVRYSYIGHAFTFGDIQREHDKAHLDLLVHTDPGSDARLSEELLSWVRSRHVSYASVPPVLAEVPRQIAIERLGLLPLLSLKPTPLDGWGRVFKRVSDIICSAMLLVLLSPLLLLIALLILAEDGRPIFYVSKRTGDFGRKTIPVLKFRSMIRNADKHKHELLQKNHRTDGPLFKVRNDPRVTRIGAVLRRSSLDELPQLFNVLIGQLSLVGPRPHLPEEVRRYSDYQRRVLAIRPGVTGFAQVSGRSDLSFDEEVRLDLRYIEQWSPLLDLWILWRTLIVVLKGKGAD